MIGWLSRMLGLSRDRCIFRYWDGKRNRRGDPLAIMSLIEDECPDLAELLQMASADAAPALMPGPVKDELEKGKKGAAKKLADVSRRAFGVKPLTDSEGLTDWEVFSLLTAFLRFMGGLAEAARPLPESQPAGSRSPPDSLTASCVESGTTAA